MTATPDGLRPIDYNGHMPDTPEPPATAAAVDRLNDTIARVGDAALARLGEILDRLEGS